MKTANDARPLVSVIDLHRAQIRKSVPFRYQVKDVAGLYFSALDLPLSRRDVWLFIKNYSGCSVKSELTANRKFWLAVYRTAIKLYQKEFKCFPAHDPLTGI